MAWKKGFRSRHEFEFFDARIFSIAQKTKTRNSKLKNHFSSFIQLIKIARRNDFVRFDAGYDLMGVSVFGAELNDFQLCDALRRSDG